MGDDPKDDDQRWLPPSSKSQPSGSTPPPGGGPGAGEVKWGAPATPTPPGQPVFHPQDAPSESSGKATAALVLGIVGLLLCPWICSVLALVFGYQSRKEIDNSNGRLSNRGLSTAGIVLGWVGIVYAVGITIYIITQLDTPDNDGNGVPDGIDNAAVMPVLVAGARFAGLALS